MTESVILPLAVLVLFSASPIAAQDSAQSGGRTELRRIESDDPDLRQAIADLGRERSCATLSAVASRYRQLSVIDSAMRFYEEALAVAPRCAEAHDGVAILLRNAGMLAPALASAHRATYYAPKKAEYWNTLGTIHQALGKVESAEAAYRRSTDLDPAAVYALSNRCYLSLQAGDAARATEFCKAALRIDPDFTPAANNLALIAALSGDGRKAFEMFASTRGLAAAHYNMGMILLAERDFAGALREFESAYRADPDFDDAHAAARRTRKMQKQLAEKTRADNPRR